MSELPCQVAARQDLPGVLTRGILATAALDVMTIPKDCFSEIKGNVDRSILLKELWIWQTGG